MRSSHQGAAAAGAHSSKKRHEAEQNLSPSHFGMIDLYLAPPTCPTLCTLLRSLPAPLTCSRVFGGIWHRHHQGGFWFQGPCCPASGRTKQASLKPKGVGTKKPISCSTGRCCWQKINRGQLQQSDRHQRCPSARGKSITAFCLPQTEPGMCFNKNNERVFCMKS